MSNVPDMGQPAEDLRAADGRVPGRRGRATRTKLLERLESMLATSAFRDLKVTDVTREAGTSPATFYQYFPDIETAVLAIADEMAQQGTHLKDTVSDHSWKGTEGYAAAESIVDGFLAFWQEHQSLLRVIDLAALEGDTRFRDTRTRMLNAVVVDLADVISGLRSGPADGEPDPVAMAGALVGMLAHNAAHQAGFETWEIHVTDLRTAMSDLVYWGVTGKKPTRK